MIMIIQLIQCSAGLSRGPMWTDSHAFSFIYLLDSFSGEWIRSHSLWQKIFSATQHRMGKRVVAFQTGPFCSVDCQTRTSVLHIPTAVTFTVRSVPRWYRTAILVIDLIAFNPILSSWYSPMHFNKLLVKQPISFVPQNQSNQQTPKTKYRIQHIDLQCQTMPIWPWMKDSTFSYCLRVCITFESRSNITLLSTSLRIRWFPRPFESSDQA